MSHYARFVVLVLVELMVGATLLTTAGSPPAEAATSQPVVHFVIDTSGSMFGDRIANAIAGVKATAALLPDTTAVGLRSYAGDCDQSSVESRVPIGLANDAAINTAADALVADGGTPTTAALQRGLDELLAYNASGPKRIVLLTDGDTACGVTICDFMRGYDLQGVEISLFTVGLQVSPGATTDLTCAAELTGGRYIPADDPNELAQDLANAAQTIPDDDGDGLPNAWETGGLRSGTGAMLVNLPALGADPDDKDLFVRIDAAANIGIAPRARRIVVDAFAAQGVKLHIIDGPTLTKAQTDLWRDVQVDGTVVPDLEQIYSEWAGSNWQNAATFHYVAIVGWNEPAVSWSGVTAERPSQVSVLNPCRMAGALAGCRLSARDQAILLMHQLGHQLGLRHGGGDDINYKPNYLSVMNSTYAFEARGVPGVGITYSSWGASNIASLDESTLSETTGLVDLDDSVPSSARFVFFCPGDGRLRTASFDERVNWNCTRSIQAGAIQANINVPLSRRRTSEADTVLGTFGAYNDWANLDYTGGGNIGSRSAEWVDGDPVE